MPLALDLVLTPNRSFDRQQTRWLIGGVGAIFLLGGLRLCVLGAWPVLPFMGIDLALLWWAFRSSNAAGRSHERVMLDAGALTVERVSPRGVVRRIGLDAYWTRVHIEETPLGDAHVFLAMRQRRVRVGSCLSAPERREIGAVIAAALADYRAGIPSTSSIV